MDELKIHTEFDFGLSWLSPSFKNTTEHSKPTAKIKLPLCLDAGMTDPCINILIYFNDYFESEQVYRVTKEYYTYKGENKIVPTCMSGTELRSLLVTELTYCERDIIKTTMVIGKKENELINLNNILVPGDKVITACEQNIDLNLKRKRKLENSIKRISYLLYGEIIDDKN